MNTPRAGKAVRGSKTGRPIMAALDLLGRRNSLRILWELRAGTALTFRALQDAAMTNPSLLNTRLKELREAGLVEHRGEGYQLSFSGSELLTALQPLSDWAQRWARTATRTAGEA
jgi:DNA-binding HxlR family transcriptional regulator